MSAGREVEAVSWTAIFNRNDLIHAMLTSVPHANTFNVTIFPDS